MRKRINRLRRWATQLMCYLFLFVQCEQAKVQAQGLLSPVSITIILITGGTVTYVVVQMFKPSYRCWGDPENPGTNWCSTMTMLTGRKSGLVGPGINFRSYKKCMCICTTNCTGTNALALYLRGTNSSQSFTSNSAPPDMLEMYVVQKSYDLHTWISCGVLQDVGGDTDDGRYLLEYREPQETGRQCLFRVMVAYVEDPALLKKKL